MTNRDYIRNLLLTITAELGTLRVPRQSDLNDIDTALDNAKAELDALDAENIDESYHVKALYDRLKAVAIHERIVRNNLDRIHLATQACLHACDRISEQVEDEPAPEDDSL